MIESTTFTRYVLRCDGCGYRNASLADGFGSEELAVSNALRRNWSYTEEDGYRCLQCQHPGRIIIPKLDTGHPFL